MLKPHLFQTLWVTNPTKFAGFIVPKLTSTVLNSAGESFVISNAALNSEGREYLLTTSATDSDGNSFTLFS